MSLHIAFKSKFSLVTSNHTMSSLIQKLAKLAIINFNRDPGKSSKLFNTQFEQVKALASKITSEDINLDLRLLGENRPYDVRI